MYKQTPYISGAVGFGLDPDVIKSRCSCLTYGVGVLHRFDSEKHPVRKKVTKDNVDWCTDVFDVFVTVNQSVEFGDSIIRRYTPVRRDQTATTINIYSTDSDRVTFVSDPDVQKCGTLTLKLSDTVHVGQRREIRTEMLFGDTEIRVRAVDVNGDQVVEASIDFINI